MRVLAALAGVDERTTVRWLAGTGPTRKWVEKRLRAALPGARAACPAGAKVYDQAPA